MTLTRERLRVLQFNENRSKLFRNNEDRNDRVCTTASNRQEGRRNERHTCRAAERGACMCTHAYTHTHSFCTYIDMFCSRSAFSLPLPLFSCPSLSVRLILLCSVLCHLHLFSLSDCHRGAASLLRDMFPHAPWQAIKQGILLGADKVCVCGRVGVCELWVVQETPCRYTSEVKHLSYSKPPSFMPCK